MENIKDEIKNWNLGSDKLLHSYLVQFSQNVIGKTKAVQDDLDTLLYESNNSVVKLQNTFNQFLMLGTQQFIENVSSLRYCLPP